MNETLYNVDWNAAKLVHEDYVDFGIADERGRRVGFAWFVYEIGVTVAGADQRSGYLGRTFKNGAGIYYRVTSHATRNGKSYGALTEDAYLSSYADALKEGARRTEVARKRYLRKYRAK